MCWFEQLTGFQEANYCDTRARLAVDGNRLRSLANGQSYGIGRLELVSLSELRQRAALTAGSPARTTVGLVTGNVRQMHQRPENAGALFQVASQFNLLEMMSPAITPEHGVARYERDPTQGPACAIACGAATIYRNYFAPLGDQIGQTGERQINTLADLGEALASALGRPVGELWDMKNGYALCSRDGLDSIAQYLRSLEPEDLDALRGKLRIGLHWDVEVTDAPDKPRPVVSQAFCSALPVTYTQIGAQHWEPFANLILEAAYEATMLAGLVNARRGNSNTVLLTRLGGGAFGNRDEWIDAAMRRALTIASGFGLDVKLVSYGQPSKEMSELVRDFG